MVVEDGDKFGFTPELTERTKSILSLRTTFQTASLYACVQTLTSLADSLRSPWEVKYRDSTG